jgi:hypothetical protein
VTVGELDVVAAEVHLGLIDEEDLPAVAFNVLGEGLDSPALVSLASLGSSDATNARLLFDRAMEELDVPIRNLRDAVMRMARKVATEIIGGTVAPYAGAKRIWDLSTRLSIDQIPELHPFIYAADEWEARPEDRTFFEDVIVSEASSLVSQ